MDHFSEHSFPIGVFDSGVGGLTVLQQLIRVLPNESFVYLGDTARLPYGEKSCETVVRYSIENANFLLKSQIKMLVVACSTASSHALETLQQKLSIPVVGMIEPGAEQAVKLSTHGRIAVLGTRGTISSQSYQKAILKHNPQAYILPVACPLFVPLVEEHFIEHPAALLVVQEYLKPLKEQRIDTVILGCTHYPLLKPLISIELGEGIEVVDSASACAEVVSNLLNGQSFINKTQISENKYFVSDDPEKFQKLGRKFLGMPIEHVELVQVSSAPKT